MEEGNLNCRRKRWPDGEGGGSDPVGLGAGAVWRCCYFGLVRAGQGEVEIL